MKRILFGGPEEGYPHGDIVTRLDDAYNVMYVNDGATMLWELDTARFTVDEHARPYDLVIYDTRLFWGDAITERRVELFSSHVVQYLGLPKKPVIVLADGDIAQGIHAASDMEGFTKLDDPYSVDDVVAAVVQMLPDA